jgi:hypothetical protein
MQAMAKDPTCLLNLVMSGMTDLICKLTLTLTLRRKTLHMISAILKAEVTQTNSSMVMVGVHHQQEEVDQEEVFKEAFKIVIKVLLNSTMDMEEEMVSDLLKRGLIKIKKKTNAQILTSTILILRINLDLDTLTLNLINNSLEQEEAEDFLGEILISKEILVKEGHKNSEVIEEEEEEATAADHL